MKRGTLRTRRRRESIGEVIGFFKISLCDLAVPRCPPRSRWPWSGGQSQSETRGRVMRRGASSLLGALSLFWALPPHTPPTTPPPPPSPRCPSPLPSSLRYHHIL